MELEELLEIAEYSKDSSFQIRTETKNYVTTIYNAEDKELGHLVTEGVRVKTSVGDNEYFAIVNLNPDVKFSMDGLAPVKEEGVCSLVSVDGIKASIENLVVEYDNNGKIEYDAEKELFLAKIREFTQGGHLRNLGLLSCNLELKEIDDNAVQEGLLGYLEAPANTFSVALNMIKKIGIKRANLLTGCDYIKELRKSIAERGTGDAAYGFAKEIPGADIDALCKRVAEVGTGDVAYGFAKEFPGADILALSKRVAEVGDELRVYLFAKYVPDADIDSLQKRILEIEDAYYYYVKKFAKDVKGANKELFREKFPNLKL